jgi:hypothetical protein
MPPSLPSQDITSLWDLPKMAHRQRTFNLQKRSPQWLTPAGSSVRTATIRSARTGSSRDFLWGPEFYN